MQALRIHTTVDGHLVAALPELQPIMGRHVELIALVVDSKPSPNKTHTLSFEELLHRRLQRPAFIKPVTLEDMELAILFGATDASR